MGRSNFRTDLLRICVVWYAERNRQPCITVWIISDINLLNCNFGEFLKLSSRQCPPLVYHYILHNTFSINPVPMPGQFPCHFRQDASGCGLETSKSILGLEQSGDEILTMFLPLEENEVTFLSTYITWPYRILLQFTVLNLFIPSILVTDKYRKTSWHRMSYACFS